MTVPGWTITSGEPNVVCYGASGFPTQSTPGSPTRKESDPGGIAAVPGGAENVFLATNGARWSLIVTDQPKNFSFSDSLG